jgi:hypothetical protein
MATDEIPLIRQNNIIVKQLHIDNNEHYACFGIRQTNRMFHLNN